MQCHDVHLAISDLCGIITISKSISPIAHGLFLVLPNNSSPPCLVKSLSDMPQATTYSPPSGKTIDSLLFLPPTPSLWRAQRTGNKISPVSNSSRTTYEELASDKLENWKQYRHYSQLTVSTESRFPCPFLFGSLLANDRTTPLTCDSVKSFPEGKNLPPPPPRAGQKSNFPTGWE